jgi:hypothetical protein
MRITADARVRISRCIVFQCCFPALLAQDASDEKNPRAFASAMVDMTNANVHAFPCQKLVTSVVLTSHEAVFHC